MLKKILFRVAFAFIILLIFNEYIIYYVTLSQCNWPVRTSNTGVKPVKALILADIHMLGPFRGHWLDKLRREWQMHRAFQTTMTLFQPNVVFILGDLFDEGERVNDQQFQAYAARFQRLFHVPKGTQIFGAIGNHDVGFHYKMRPALYERFNQVYTNPPNTVVSIDDVHFVLINSMAMEGDQCTICKSAQADITHIAKRLMCAKDRKSCKNNTKPVNGTYSQPILLQHFPTYRDSDALCTEHDDDVEPEVYRQRWEVLSKESTDWLADVLKPRAVFSGHSHNYCRSKTRWNVDEYTISSYSWRNKNNPRFLLAEFTSDDYAVEVCNMPYESTVIQLYLVGMMVAVTIIVSLECAKRRRRLRAEFIQKMSMKIS